MQTQRTVFLFVLLLSAFPRPRGRHLTQNAEALSASSLPKGLVRLTEELPLEGELVTDALKFGLSVTPVNGTFPNILLSLEVLNVGANADMFCVPFDSAETENRQRWSSEDSQSVDYVFITTNSPYYAQAVAEDESVADFLCTVSHVSHENPVYFIEMNVSHAKRVMDATEQEAVEGIYTKCCKETEACVGWVEKLHSVELEEKEAVRRVTNFDMCHVASNICDEEGHLLKLSLDRFGLQCEFPMEEIAKLERIQKISMIGNQLSGDIYDIADSMKDLKDLTELSLSFNRISGSLKREGENELQNPLCILTVTELQHLHLASNQITGPLPDCLFEDGSLLRDLVLSQNPIGGSIPNVIPKGSHFEMIQMASATLSGKFPESFIHTENLVLLDLSNNDIEGSLPDAFGPSPKLKNLFLSGNRFTGMVPRGIARSETLETVRLHHNAFDSLPGQWLRHGPRTPLVHLDISFNKIEEDFPVALALQQHLSTLYINNNKFRGPLPTLSDMFPNAWVLNMSSNAFSGNLPQEWTSLGMLAGTAQELSYTAPLLDLSFNQLVGKVPTFFFEVNNFPKKLLVADSVNLEGNDFLCPEFGTANHLKGFDHCDSEDDSVFGESVFVVQNNGGDDGGATPGSGPSAFGADTSDDTDEAGLLSSRENEDQSSSSDDNMTLWIVVAIVSTTLLVSVTLGIVMRYRVLRLAKATMGSPEHAAEIRTVQPEALDSTKNLDKSHLRAGVESSDATPL